MPTQDILLTPPTLPATYCIGSGVAGLQEFVNLVIGGTTAQLLLTAGMSYYNFGAAVPAADKRSYPWYRWSGTNPELNGWYVFASSYWLRPHMWVPSGPERLFVVMDASLVDTYDGGEAGTSTTLAGPMWQVDTDMSAKFAVGAGTLPSGAIINVDDTGGEDTHVLVTAELPSHSHTMSFERQDTAGGDQPNTVYDGTDHGADAYTTVSRQTSTTGSGTAHNNMPPYYTGLWLKRTARIYYRLGP